MRCGLAVCLLLVLCLGVNRGISEHSDADTSTNSPLTTTPTGTSDRSGRKYVSQYEVDEGGAPLDFNHHYGPQASARALPKSTNYLPYRHAGSGVMKKSGTNVNWSVWKGDENADDEGSDEAESPKWPLPSGPWAASDPWAVDPTYLMMLKNAMADIKADTKPVGFLSKLGSDPALLLIAASIPISLLLAAALPTIMNMIMNGSNVPLISTTATGNGNKRGHQEQLDILPYLSPFMEAIGTFGVRSMGNPDCMQRIFCQVAEDKISANKATYLKKALNIARFVSDGNWLENFGVKELVDSLSTGKCEDIPCSKSKSKSKADTSKSRYSRKLHETNEKP